MNFEKYENKLEFPLAPTKPKLTGNKSADHRQYAQDLDTYDVRLEVYKAALEIYNKADRELEEQFKIDALEEVGLSNLPKWQQDKIYDYAWEESHSGGYTEVYNTLIDLVDLFIEPGEYTLVFREK